MSVVHEKLRPPKLNHCPEIFAALLYRSWHSDPNDRPTPAIIKNILQLILNALPKKKQEYTEDMADRLTQRWTDGHKLNEKYLPNEPRLGNEQSMNIYQEHLTVMERVMNIKKDINELKEKRAKHEDYELLLEENRQLEQEIEKLRSQTLS
jgi:hypothetical protein